MNNYILAKTKLGFTYMPHALCLDSVSTPSGDSGLAAKNHGYDVPESSCRWVLLSIESFNEVKTNFVACFSALTKVGSQSNPSNYLVFLCLANRYSYVLSMYVQMTRNFFLMYSTSTLFTSICSLREVNCLRILEISLPNSNAALLKNIVLPYKEC